MAGAAGFLENFGVRAEAYEFNNAFFFVPPNQKGVVFYMAFHISAIVACQQMRSVFGRDRQTICEQIENIFKLGDYFGLVFVALRSFLNCEVSLRVCLLLNRFNK